MKRTIASITVGLLLTGCSAGSQPIAAPVTKTVTAVATTTRLATMTQAVTVAETTTEVTTLLEFSTETVVGPDVTVTNPPKTKTVVKTVDRPVTEVQTATVTATVTPEAAAAPPPPAAAAGSFPDGSYLIGSEMPAGNYTATGGTNTCVWLTYDSAHNPVSSGNGRIATLPATSYSFESLDCGTWSPTG